MSAQVTAICHDLLKERALVGGTIEEVSESGCLLVTSSANAVPEFSPRSRVGLSILDHASGRSAKTKARVVSVRFEGRCWIYELRWPALPELWEAK